jgi:hypothetical protein
VLLEVADAHGTERQELHLPLAEGDRRTSHWLEGDVVPVTYDIPTGALGAGDFQLEVGLLADQTPVTALDAAGAGIADGTLDLAERIEITGQETALALDLK